MADDDLDTLMAQYEQQAQQDMAKVTKKPATPRNAREKLQQGLQTHLDSDNKCVHVYAPHVHSAIAAHIHTSATGDLPC